MPITVDWDNQEKNTICYTYVGRWTWDEYYVVLEHSRGLWKSVNQVVDVIVDLSASAGFPSGNLLEHLRKTYAYYDDPKAGNTAVVGTNDFFRMAVELFNKIYMNARHKKTGNFFLVKDMNAARSVLNEQRQKRQSTR